MSRFNLKQKIIIFLVAFVGMFSAGCVNAVSVSAADSVFVPPDTITLPALQDYDTTKYPYFIKIYQGQYSSGNTTPYFFSVWYLASSEPITLSYSMLGDYNRMLFFTSKDCFYQYNHVSGTDPTNLDWDTRVFSDYATSTYAPFVDFTKVLYTNHDIKDKDGNIVFHKPLLTTEDMTPVLVETQEGAKIIVGGMICLIVLVVSLVGLRKYLKPFLTQ